MCGGAGNCCRPGRHFNSLVGIPGVAPPICSKPKNIRKERKDNERRRKEGRDRAERFLGAAFNNGNERTKNKFTTRDQDPPLATGAAGRNANQGTSARATSGGGGEAQQHG
jgi:hypothetical protein